MKTFNGFLYHDKDKVVVNPRKEPNKSDHRNAMNHYRRKYAKWESNNIEVENMWKEYIINKLPNFIRWYSNWHWNPTNYIDNMIRINNAQPCTCKMSGDKAVVLKLK